MSWELRRAEELDLAAIMALERETFPDDAWSIETMAAELASPHGFYLVADDVDHDDAISGYAGLLAPAGSGQGDIQTVAVAASARRRGLARAMLQALLEEAALREAREVFLEVCADNPAAIALYTSEGFERIGLRPGYYGGTVDAISMRRRTRP